MAELVAAHSAPPDDDTVVFVHVRTTDALCGPRGKAELSGALAELGYTYVRERALRINLH